MGEDKWDEKKTEECPNCKKKIGILESVYHDSLCSDCYWGDE